MWERWKGIAFAARYGHQQIDMLIGRRPTEFELRLFQEAILDLLEDERERGDLT